MPLMWHYGLKEIQFIAANCCPGRIWARESSQGNNKAQSHCSGAARSHPAVLGAVLYLVKSVSGHGSVASAELETGRGWSLPRHSLVCWRCTIQWHGGGAVMPWHASQKSISICLYLICIYIVVLTPRHQVPFLLDGGVLAEVLVFRRPSNTTSSFTSICNRKCLPLFTLFLTSFDLGGVLRRRIMVLQIFLSVCLLSNGRLLLLHIFSCSCNTVDGIRKYFLFYFLLKKA